MFDLDAILMQFAVVKGEATSVFVKSNGKTVALPQRLGELSVVQAGNILYHYNVDIRILDHHLKQMEQKLITCNRILLLERPLYIVFHTFWKFQVKVNQVKLDAIESLLNLWQICVVSPCNTNLHSLIHFPLKRNAFIWTDRPSWPFANTDGLCKSRFLKAFQGQSKQLEYNHKDWCDDFCVMNAASQEGKWSKKCYCFTTGSEAKFTF